VVPLPNEEEHSAIRLSPSAFREISARVFTL
jgi:hypothetical protein